jgi:hypothetical protein
MELSSFFSFFYLMLP